MAQSAGWKVDLDVGGTNNSFHVTVRILLTSTSNPNLENHSLAFRIWEGPGLHLVDDP